MEKNVPVPASMAALLSSGIKKTAAPFKAALKGAFKTAPQAARNAMWKRQFDAVIVGSKHSGKTRLGRSLRDLLVQQRETGMDVGGWRVTDVGWSTGLDMEIQGPGQDQPPVGEIDELWRSQNVEWIKVQLRAGNRKRQFSILVLPGEDLLDETTHRDTAVATVRLSKLLSGRVVIEVRNPLAHDTRVAKRGFLYCLRPLLDSTEGIESEDGAPLNAVISARTLAWGDLWEVPEAGTPFADATLRLMTVLDRNSTLRLGASGNDFVCVGVAAPIGQEFDAAVDALVSERVRADAKNHAVIAGAVAKAKARHILALPRRQLASQSNAYPIAFVTEGKVIEYDAFGEIDWARLAWTVKPNPAGMHHSSDNAEAVFGLLKQALDLSGMLAPR